MKEVSLIEVTNLLQKKGVDAHYTHTGGGCGTIVFGEYDEDGFYEFVCGPSSYYTGLAWDGDLCFGEDGKENFVGLWDLDPLTPETVANAIIEMVKGWSK